MKPTHTKPCDQCNGSGLVVRLKRRLTDGSVDPTDTVEWPQALCEKCGGGGQVSYVPAESDVGTSGDD